MGTCIRHGAVAKVAKEVFEFPGRQRIAGFDGMATDGLGDHLFTEAQGVDIASGGHQFIDQLENEPSGIGGLDEWGQGIEEKGAIAELGEAHAQARQDGEVFLEELCVARGDLDGFGQEQSLGGGGFLFETVEHLFVEDTFVGGVLIHEDQTAVGFEEHIEIGNDANEPKRGGKQGRGGFLGRRRREAC